MTSSISLAPTPTFRSPASTIIRSHVPKGAARLNYRSTTIPSLRNDRRDSPQSVRDNMSIHMQSTFIVRPTRRSPPRTPEQTASNPHGNARYVQRDRFFGYKEPYTGTEFYYNPEPFQGFGLAHARPCRFLGHRSQKAGLIFRSTIRRACFFAMSLV